MLLNEQVMFERNGAKISIAGIDDADFYQVDNIEKAAADIPQDAFSILLSHTPETYDRPHMPGSIFCWLGIRMAVRSACLAAFRSCFPLSCRAAWAKAHGYITVWLDTPRSAPDPAVFRSASTAPPK